ncbi:MAG: TonB family protein [Spirochaetaceae bacterium]|jgi:protein TonB|nr:TonB family protein [Spirochaetaceae bacterium]
MNRLRTALFFIVALLHGLLILFLAFKMETLIEAPDPEPQVMRLVDVAEDTPPPPPPPPKEPPPPVLQNTVEAVAETMIETDEVPPDQAVAPLTPAPRPRQVRSQEIEYLSMGKISEKPDFDMKALAAYLERNYPPIARRSGLGGRVILELFIDAQGVIRRIDILREEPAGRGFGEIAKRAFSEIGTVKPAKANDAPVAVHYRYPITFKVDR